MWLRTVDRSLLLQGWQVRGGEEGESGGRLSERFKAAAATIVKRWINLDGYESFIAPSFARTLWKTLSSQRELYITHFFQPGPPGRG